MAYGRDVPWHPHYLISTLLLWWLIGAIGLVLQECVCYISMVGSWFGDRTAKSRLSEMRVTESQFADDVALYATSRDSFEAVAAEFVKVASEWGLTEY